MYGCSTDEIASILYAAAVTCGRYVPGSEIESTLRNAARTVRKVSGNNSILEIALAIPLPPPWPELNQKKRKTIIARSKAGLPDLCEASPWLLDEDVRNTEEIIDQLFPGDPLLCAGPNKYDFETKLRSEWCGELAALQFIVPNTMISRIGLTKEGRPSAHAKSNTGPRRFLVVEQDRGSIDEQAAILMHLAEYAPLVLAIHSGGKSVHGWFYCRDESEQAVREFMDYAVSLGADPQLWIRSQFTRMPDGRREHGRRQTIFYFAPETLT
jgi:hypothetical protein